MQVWDDNTSNAIISEGVVATRDEELRQYGQNSRVNLRLVPMLGREDNLLNRFQNRFMFTHHQKQIIADTPDNEIVAYVGGIDLTYGRFDDNGYPLFRTLQTIHRDDFHNACSDVSSRNGPRQPWHDIHARIQGNGILDLLQNFEERWKGQGGNDSELVSIEESQLRATCEGRECKDLNTTWSTQLFRSIDDRTAKFRHEEIESQSLNDNQNADYEEKISDSKSKNDRSSWRPNFQTQSPHKDHRFSSSNFLHVPSILRFGTKSKHYTIPHGKENYIKIYQPLDKMRSSKVDSSAHKALVYHIRQAEHVVYIESQYFLSSSYLWYHRSCSSCCNTVAAEVTYKICQKIAKGERFSAYICIPLWPEGLPSSTVVQDILGYQASTIEAMYTKIHRAIQRKKRTCKEFKHVLPTDYLSFYSLANRETREDGQDIQNGTPLNNSRRHLVYVVRVDQVFVKMYHCLCLVEYFLILLSMADVIAFQNDHCG
jgi:phospholipase D1/2